MNQSYAHLALSSTARHQWTQFADTFQFLFADCGTKAYHGVVLPNRGWITRRGPLPIRSLHDHLQGLGDCGIRGRHLTRFAIIDLDLHSGNRWIFLQQLKILLNWAASHAGWGMGWHVQVAEQNAGGIHLICVLPCELPLATVRKEIRRELCGLDLQHPEIKRQIRRSRRSVYRMHRQSMMIKGFKFPQSYEENYRTGLMRPFSKVEIYPDTQRIIRLPLGSGRTILADEPILDVESYVRWLYQTNRSTISQEEIERYVWSRLVERDWHPGRRPIQSSTISFIPPPVPHFDFTPFERRQIRECLLPVLSAPIDECEKVTKWFLGFVAQHKGQIARDWLPELFLMADSDIRMERTNKRSDFLRVMRDELQWIRVVIPPVCYPKKGGGKLHRGWATTYAVGQMFHDRLG